MSMKRRKNPYDPIVDLYQPARKRARNYLGYAREARAKGSPEAAFLLRVAKAHKKSAADIRKSPFHKWAWAKKNPRRNPDYSKVSGPTPMQRLKMWRKLRTMSKAGARRRWYTENIKEALTQIRRRKARR